MNRHLTEGEAFWSLICIIFGMVFWVVFAAPVANACIDTLAMEAVR
jgi:hypothetical protein